MYDQAGAPVMWCLAPMLTDISAGILYLHSHNIVHGGRHAWQARTQVLRGIAVPYSGPEGQAWVQILSVSP